MHPAVQAARSSARLAFPRRCMATATASPSGVHVQSSSSSASGSVIPLSNVEAQWERMTTEEQLTVHQQLEAVQKRDWKTLSVDEKKAAYYVAFGPHGPRTPVTPVGQTQKIIGGLGLAIGLSAALFFGIRATAPEPPKTLTKEWQEASNERAIEQKMNPISGITSEGYKGKGFVQQ